MESHIFFLLKILLFFLVEPPELRCVFGTTLLRNALYYSDIANYRSGFAFVVQIPTQNEHGGVQYISGKLAFDRSDYATNHGIYYPTTAPRLFTKFKAGEEQFATSEVSSFIVTHVLRVRKEPGKSQYLFYYYLVWVY